MTGVRKRAQATRFYVEAVAQVNQQRKLVLQEVLLKPGAETLPLAEQEFYELCIEESDNVFRPGFIVKQTHAQWSEIGGQVMCGKSRSGSGGRRSKRLRKDARSGGRLSLQRDLLSRMWIVDVMTCIEINMKLDFIVD